MISAPLGVSSGLSGQKVPRRARSARLGLAVLIALVVAWLVVKYALGIPYIELPSPVQVAQSAWSDRDQLTSAAGSTLVGALGGFVVGNAVAVLAAILVATSRVASRLLMPIALVVRTLPVIALAPLLTLVMGVGQPTIITIAALIIFFPTLVNTSLGLRAIAPEMLELMAVGNASRLDVLLRVRLPHAVPYFLTGLQMAAATCILGAMVAEWVTSGSGLGFLILEAGSQVETSLMFAGVLVAAVLALVLFALTGWIARRLSRYTGAG